MQQYKVFNDLANWQVLQNNLVQLLGQAYYQRTGFLADAHDTKQLAAGIGWVVDAPEHSSGLQLAARSNAEEKYNQVTNAGR